jgi:hypothetical protein
MQLKIRRSQRDAGIVSTHVLFCLNARAELSAIERDNLARYKLYDQVIYNSEASKRHLAKGMAAGTEGSVRSDLKAWGHLAMAKLRLNVTVRSLERGQYIECKSMEELRDAENAIILACQNLKTYLEMAATFDGTEQLIDFSGNEPTVIAQAIQPEPILAPPMTELTSEAPFALEGPEDYETFESGPPSDAFYSAGASVGNAIDWISGVAGLDRRRAVFLVIGVVALILVLLVSMCHG